MDETQIKLTGQSFKSLREIYEMSYEDFKACIAPIKRSLDKMTNRKRYQNLTPKQVKLIVEHIG